MLKILLIIVWVAIFIQIYLMYQMKRNTKVCDIRIKWVHDKDNRLDKYTYDEMFMPKFKNWLGLRYPKEKHFK